MAKVSFFRCTRTVFNTYAAQTSNLHDGDIYFITDEGCIEQVSMDNSTPVIKRYGEHVEFVTTLPQYPLTNVLYIHNNVGKRYDGNNTWTTLFEIKAPDNTAADIATGNADAVSGNAVRSYLDANYPLGSTQGCVVFRGTGGIISTDVLPANIAYLTDGKIPASQLPAIALSEYVGDANILGSYSGEDGLYALTAQPGDWARVTNPATGHESEEGTYIYTQTSANPDVYEWKLMAEHVDTVTVDSTLSSTSENPVQNKVINSALAAKITNPSTSGISTGTCQFLKAENNSGTITYTWANPLEWTDLTSGS